MQSNLRSRTAQRSVLVLDARLVARSGALDAPTSGLAPGYVQGNLAILPTDYAEDFLRFCQANPKPCPLIGVSEPGDPAHPGARRRSRHPHRFSALSRLARRRRSSTSRAISKRSGATIWSASSSAARSRSRRRCSRRRAAPPYRPATAPCRCIARRSRPRRRGRVPRATGRFNAAVEACPMPIRAMQITSRYPLVHGAPVHLGQPGAIGIADLATPDYGDAVPVERRRAPGVLGLRARHAQSRGSRPLKSPSQSRMRRATCWSRT